MKLLELVGVKKHAEARMVDVLEYFTTHGGYKLAGEGGNSFVFQKPGSGEVLKVWLQDQAYERFIDVAAANQDNKFFPKLRGPVKRLRAFFKRTKQDPVWVKYVRLESLRRAAVGHDSFAGKPLGRLLTTLEYALNQGWDESKAVDYLDHTYFKHNDGETPDEPVPAELREFVAAVYLLKDKKRAEDKFDLHEGNVMWRGDQLVIIDPYYNLDSGLENVQFLTAQEHIRDGTADSAGLEVVTGSSRGK